VPAKGATRRHKQADPAGGQFAYDCHTVVRSRPTLRRRHRVVSFNKRDQGRRDPDGLIRYRQRKGPAGRTALAHSRAPWGPPSPRKGEGQGRLPAAYYDHSGWTPEIDAFKSRRDGHEGGRKGTGRRVCSSRSLMVTLRRPRRVGGRRHWQTSTREPRRPDRAWSRPARAMTEVQGRRCRWAEHAHLWCHRPLARRTGGRGTTRWTSCVRGGAAHCRRRSSRGPLRKRRPVNA